MPSVAPNAHRLRSLRLKLTRTERDLIERAAKAAGKALADFILDAARQAAEELIVDRTRMAAGRDVHVEFLKQLDCPARSSERLRRTMTAKPPWGAP